MPEADGPKIDDEIRDTRGAPVGSLRSRGPAVLRALLGTRRLQLLEADGRPIGTIIDLPSIGSDRFRISKGDGLLIAEVRKRFRFGSRKLQIRIRGGSTVEIDATSAAFTIDGSLVAESNRQHPSLSAEDLRERRYVLRFTPPLEPETKLVILAGRVVLDLLVTG